MKYFLSLILAASILQGADISKIEVWYQAQDDGPYYFIIDNSQIKWVYGPHIEGQFDHEIPLSSDAVHNIKLYKSNIGNGESNKIENPDSAAQVVVTFVDGSTQKRMNMFTNREEREKNDIFMIFMDMSTIVKYFKHMGK
jgi:hypothetical protein